MKVGINHWSFPTGSSLAESMDLAKRVGCDHIELNLAKEGELGLGTSEAEVRAIAGYAASIGLEISSLSTGLYWEFSPTGNDPGIRRQAVEILERQLTVANWLGVDTILVVPGAVTADVQYDVAYDRATAFLAAALPAALRTGVTIGVENVWNKFLLSPLEMCRFLDAFEDPDSIGAYFDVGNILSYGFPQHWIRLLGSRIKRIHVKDFNEAPGGWNSFRNLLQGDVPWDIVWDALTEIGYDGYVTAEVAGYKAYPEVGLRHVVDCLRAIVAGGNEAARAV